MTITAATARPIKIHGSAELDLLAAGELVGDGVADVVAAVGDGDGDGEGEGDGGAAEVGGAVVTCGVVGALVGLSGPAVGRLGGEMVTPWLAATLAIAFLTAPPHPATRNAAAKTPAASINGLVHLRLDITVILWLTGGTCFPRQG
jgi:hypothetical protein